MTVSQGAVCVCVCVSRCVLTVLPLLFPPSLSTWSPPDWTVSQLEGLQCKIYNIGAAHQPSWDKTALLRELRQLTLRQ